jgi:pseudouridine-5'-phosphate glycosidase
MPRSLRIKDEVREAIASGRAVVALESTVIAHGLPHPLNLETARQMEIVVRMGGAVPATIAVLNGRLCVGLSDDELEYLATAKGIRKTSCRDLPVVVAQQSDGATTVAATATLATWAGIEILATGGIGGVYRDKPHDVSNDLPTLASVPITVVCAGAKSILDLPATLEWLETAGVAVIGYGTDDFPAFYTRHSGLPIDARVDSPYEAAAIIRARRHLGLAGGTLVAVPVPAAAEVSATLLESATIAALKETRARGIEGNAATPFLLKWLARETSGASLKANVALLENNARIATQIAVALKDLD